VTLVRPLVSRGQAARRYRGYVTTAGEERHVPPFWLSPDSRRRPRAIPGQPTPSIGGTTDRSSQKDTRTLAQAEDTTDLEGVISEALGASPVDITALRRGVWTYVGEERHVGTSPGVVILRLTELIDAAPRASRMERAAVTRRVILWCVEVYFGRLGGERMLRLEDDALPTVV
jgi:hypothetical protein